MRQHHTIDPPAAGEQKGSFGAPENGFRYVRRIGLTQGKVRKNCN